jgi:molybdenum cofactor sulfurtransferase
MFHEEVITDSFHEHHAQFVKDHPAYHPKQVQDLRQHHFSRLDHQKHIYLDYTGGSLYSELLVQRHADRLKSSVLGNPHSTNPSSMASSQAVDEARRKVIDFFKAQNYTCVFTPNATGALKIIGESYPFTSRSHFLLPFDNHNSVNGIREYAKNKGASYTYSPIQLEDLRFQPDVLQQHLLSFKEADHKLFAYPAQSNVSGVQHDLKWIEEAQKNGWDVLLDASAFVPTNRLDLSAVQPDFVSLSFYKMFGYPTGLGALLIRNDKLPMLQKPWFAGGTVTLASVMAEQFFLETNHARFEDGTINYLEIPAITDGLNFLESVGMNSIHSRVKELTDYITRRFTEIKHQNGAPVVRLFGPKDTEQRGGTIILNVFDPSGHPIPFYEVEGKANKENFSIRSGCFCNPGIDEINNNLEQDTLRTYFETRTQGDFIDMQEYLHQMRGAIRISLGIASNFRDVYLFEQFLRSFSK